MRFVWAIVCTLMISTSALAGGMSGGTGIGGLIEEITEDIQAILKLPIKLDTDIVRRILMRLWVHGEAEIKFGDKTILIKWKINHQLHEYPKQHSDIIVVSLKTIDDQCQ